MKEFILVFGLLATMAAMTFASGQGEQGVLTVPIEIITAANPVSPETTSMIYIHPNIDILRFDKTVVQWLGNEDPRTGVIIPSGLHTLAGHIKGGILNLSSFLNAKHTI
jgi:hypothetical protein